ncbi:MAG: glycerol-3-phosphate 1-O-acyltransferase PlsB [Pseudobacteriovorax sp.]|nr:glycerol-3-phosphate 1-O-acyltransferase PlsB [Pseudobacteriovorax sp.]
MSYFNYQVSKVFELLLRPFIYFIVTRVSPEDLVNELAKQKGHLVYVLPKRSKIDGLVLRAICRKYRLPYPEYELNLSKRSSACILYINNSGAFRSKKSLKPHKGLLKIIGTQKSNTKTPIKMIPISPFWGKNPGRDESSIWRLIFNDDEHAGWLQRFFIILFQARNNILYFSDPHTLTDMKDEGDTERQARKLKRLLRIQFRNQRNTVLGKELYMKEQVVHDVASGKLVRQAIESEMEATKKTSSRNLETKARRYVRELAADQRYTMVRTFEILLGRLWNKLFDGVEIQNLQNVRSLASQNYEIVYVPTHRSHLDYLLTSYTIYESGMPSPHIAAGINLNFWPAGWFLRRAGAFFIRRSFRGKKLYTAVVNEYVHFLLKEGYPLTFFPEGGRSRTGKLLPLKTGMLAMVVHSFIRNSIRPIAFVPVYLGYDKVMEVGSYMSELGGKKKAKESITALLKARKFLKSYYGKVHVSYGKPVILSEFMDEHQSDWRECDGNLEKPQWMPSLVAKLADEISVRMNKSAVVNPISLVGLALLSTPQNALPKEELTNFIDTFLELHQILGSETNVKTIGRSGEEILAMAQRLNIVSTFQHSGGDVLHLQDQESITISYYRNNIVHLFAIPSLIAGFFRQQRQMTLGDIKTGCAELYPFLKDEFFLPWSESELPEIVDTYSKAMVKVGLLVMNGDLLEKPRPAFDQYENLNILAACLGLTFERYTITLALLSYHSKKGFVDEKSFELQCQKMAQRLAILNGVNNPEFADKGFIFKHLRLLKKKGLLIPEDNGQLRIDQKIRSVAKESMKLLSYDARYSIDRIFASKQ